MDMKTASGKIAAQKELVAAIRDEVGKVIVGQEKLVDRLVLALITGGHILLEHSRLDSRSYRLDRSRHPRRSCSRPRYRSLRGS